MSNLRDYTDDYKDLVKAWLSPAITELEAHTSGSTGNPKQILLSKTRMRQSARRTIEFFGIDRTWLLGSCISAKYIGGKMMAVRALEVGCQLVCEPPSNRPDLRLARKTWKKSLISVVPSQMWHILTLSLSEEEKERIQFLIGGSAIPAGLRVAIVANGLNAWESYGMTETCSHIALRKVTKEEVPFSPLPGIEIAKSAEGTLIICNATEEELVTNDLVEIDTEGNFRILGRLDNVIISGGLKVIPEQTESKLKTILATSPWSAVISELMIIPRPNDKWGQVPVLLLEIPALNPTETDTIPTTTEILNYLKKYKSTLLLPQEFPQTISILSSLPRTPNGKLQRRTQAS